MTTIDDSLSEIRSVRNDIWHCRKLLQHNLPDAEREMIEKRLLERRSAFEGLLASIPVGVEALNSPKGLDLDFQKVVHPTGER